MYQLSFPIEIHKKTSIEHTQYAEETKSTVNQPQKQRDHLKMCFTKSSVKP